MLDLLINYSALEWSSGNLQRIIYFYIGYRIRVAKSIKMNVYQHNPELEFIWTVAPAGILLLMALPSLYLLYSLESSPKSLYTVVITGNQWYWTYQYTDFDVQATFVEVVKSEILGMNHHLLKKGVNFCADSISKEAFNFSKKKVDNCLNTDSLPIPDGDLPKGHPRLLSVDQPLFLPANTEVRLLITSADVIHSWAVPSLGIKMDAIPGRLNQVTFKTPFAGTCWGQCSEICGVNHAIMPVEVRIVNLLDFEPLLYALMRDYLGGSKTEFMDIFCSKYGAFGSKIDFSSYLYSIEHKAFFNFRAEINLSTSLGFVILHTNEKLVSLFLNSAVHFDKNFNYLIERVVLEMLKWILSTGDRIFMNKQKDSVILPLMTTQSEDLIFKAEINAV